MAVQSLIDYRRAQCGLLAVGSKIPIRDRRILSLVYTPGVAAPCLEISRDPAASFLYTCRGNTVGIVTDGSAVFHLGNVGPEAALPVMEGKAVILKTFAGVDAVPLCLHARDLGTMIETIALLAPSFGAFCLEDIASPGCFTLENHLQRALNVPVVHNHAHCAGIIALAGLLNALALVGKSLPEASIVIAGAGAAGIGAARLLTGAGARRLVLCDRAGAIHKYRAQRMNWAKHEIARLTNRDGRQGDLADLLRGADALIGLSAGRLITPEMIASMAPDPIIFALAVPEPEIRHEAAKAAGAAVVATSLTRSPNQLDIALAFPGLLRGLMDVQARDVTERMLIEAARALAGLIPAGERCPDRIVPEVLDLRVAPAIAAAVARAALQDGVARRAMNPEDVAERTRRVLYEGGASLVPPPDREPFSLEEEALDLHRRYRGKIEVGSTIPIRDAEVLGLVYLPPGVSRPVEEIVADPQKVFKLTIKGNFVAVVSDGSAVLGLGNIGARAALPVMEGKAVLFKTFGGVEAFPICLGTQDPDEIVEVVKAIAPVFGGINLEDISAPRCFAIEERLKRELSIPVLHDDQHGTAVVVLAALSNALKITGRRMEAIQVVVNGPGAGGIAVARMLLAVGVPDLILCDARGTLHAGRTDLNPVQMEMAERTNPRGLKGDLAEAVRGADVLIGLSVGRVVTPAMVRAMAGAPIVFAMANPIPEIFPDEARAAGAAIVATGRSDFPNQVNNSLGFPGIFRGALDVSAREINQAMEVAAAGAIAALVGEGELREECIIPDMLDFRVPVAVAGAVARAAVETGVARNPLSPEEVEARARGMVYVGKPCP
ncbi:MAG: NADP-dependent malic enzyme [Deltaproteobacteria bacterium]|nr:NADP-dependent malic enzyme [Deltaproteobacteria bacterium]